MSSKSLLLMLSSKLSFHQFSVGILDEATSVLRISSVKTVVNFTYFRLDNILLTIFCKLW